MITQRVAVGARVTPRGRSIGLSHLTTMPTVAGRERLAEALGSSVLVQLMLVMALIAMTALLYMAQASQVSVQEINIAVLKSDRMQLVSKNATLQTTASSLARIQRIDAIATNQLHMVKPDPSSTIWISPVIPRVPVLRPVGADSVAAERYSQPLAWMTRVLVSVKTSL